MIEPMNTPTPQRSEQLNKLARYLDAIGHKCVVYEGEIALFEQAVHELRQLAEEELKKTKNVVGPPSLPNQRRNNSKTRPEQLKELADRLANKHVYGAQAQLADRDEAVKELRHLAKLETDYADLKEQVEQLTPLLDQNRTMHQEVEQAKRHLAEVEAACAAMREMLTVVYEWCVTDNPSDIDGDAVKRVLDSATAGADFLEAHCDLQDNCKNLELECQDMAHNRDEIEAQLIILEAKYKLLVDLLQSVDKSTETAWNDWLFRRDQALKFTTPPPAPVSESGDKL